MVIILLKKKKLQISLINHLFYQYPYSSKWIGINMLVINPTKVIMDTAQVELSKVLEKKGFTVIPHTLRHARTLGGGHHCVTLDTWRESRPHHA